MSNGYVVLCRTHKRRSMLYKRLVEYLCTNDVRCRILPNIYVIDIIGGDIIRFLTDEDVFGSRDRLRGFHGKVVDEKTIEDYLDEEEK